MIYSKNIITLALITVALGILTTTQVNAVSTRKTLPITLQENGRVINWGLAQCIHNPNVGLICTHGNSGQGGHSQNR
ncbi:MAG: hypothetical protein WA364_13670 [Candidatus Nitrosopolaris sp.]